MCVYTYLSKTLEMCIWGELSRTFKKLMVQYGSKSTQEETDT